MALTGVKVLKIGSDADKTNKTKQILELVMIRLTLSKYVLHMYFVLEDCRLGVWGTAMRAVF